MYYNLTKNEYKKYERKFKQTYVGSQIIINRLVAFCLTIFEIFYLSLYIFPNFIKNINNMDLLELFFPVFVILILIQGIDLRFLNIEYRRELKNYIIEKTKNK